MSGFLLLIFLIGVPIYAFFAPSMISAFFAGIAATLWFLLLVGLTKKQRNFGIMRNSDEETKH